MMRFLIATLLATACDPSPQSPPQTPAHPRVVAVAPDAAVAAIDAVVEAAPRANGALVVELDAAIAKRLDPVIDQAVAEQRVVGAVVVVARDGKIIYRRTAGLADREAKRAVTEDTIFRFASMTKPIVSAAALALVDQGKLSLDDRVSKWLPEFRPKFEGKEGAITVRHLLTHMSGLSYKFIEKPDSPYHKANVSDGLAEPGLSMAEFLKRLGSVPLVHEPGTAWRYSLSVDVLGEVVARAGGGSLPDVLKRVVLDPVAMPDTAFTIAKSDRIAWPYSAAKPPVRMTDPYDRVRGAMRVRFAPGRLFDPKSFPSGGAGLAGTVGDYLRFAEAMRTHRLLRPETHREFSKNQVGSKEVDPGMSFGLGVGIIEDPAAAQSARRKGAYGWAGIYGTEFWVDPDAKLSVVVLTNTAGQKLAKEIEKALYQ
jgi:CubicO group peptidase (beta-lactamase class C family)